MSERGLLENLSSRKQLSRPMPNRDEVEVEVFACVQCKLP